jgi:2Fe-2S ferredoxin
MQAAVEHAIPGIEGDCGGLCACGTCHVYLPEDLAVLVDGPDELEQGMIEFAFDVNDSSRLSCQLIADDVMDGKRVLMPKRQY